MAATRADNGMLTVEILGATVEAFLVFFALFGGRFLIREGGSKDAGSRFNEKFDHD